MFEIFIYVYGRPDMVIFLLLKIYLNKKINIFNKGSLFEILLILMILLTE